MSGRSGIVRPAMEMSLSGVVAEQGEPVTWVRFVDDCVPRTLKEVPV